MVPIDKYYCFNKFSSFSPIFSDIIFFFPFSFLFQGQTVQHNQKTGIIVSSGDLALQSVTRHQAGNYSCIASNVEGDGESNTVQLKVMCKY